MMSKPVRKNRLLPLLLIAALPLIAGAIYLRTAPERAEHALQKATYNQLVEAVKNDPGNPRVFYYFGLRNRDLGRLGPARAALAHAAELDPDSEDIALARATVAGEAGNDQETFDALSAFLKRHPQSLKAHWALALFYAAKDAPERAYQECLAVTKQQPENAKAWRLAGIQMLKIGRYPPAEEALRHAVALDPKDWRSQLALAETLLMQHREKEALPIYQAVMAQAPEQAAITAGMGRAQLGAATEAEFGQAAQTLQRAVQLDPNSAPAELALGEAQMRLGQWPEARQALLEAERLAPGPSEVHYALKQLYEHLQDTAGAAREARLFQEAKAYEQEEAELLGQMQQVQYDPKAGLKLARLTAAHGDLTEAARQYHRLEHDPAYADIARRELEALAQLHPQLAEQSVALPLASTSAEGADSTAALLQDADGLMQQKQYAQAEQAYRAIVARNANSAAAYQGIGLAESRMGKTTEAFRALNRALRLDPHLPQAQYAMAMLYSEAGLPDEAARRLEALIKQEPNQPEYLNALGNIYRADEVTYKQAETMFRRAVALTPDNADYLDNLADMESVNNEVPAAEAHYRQALKLTPNAVRAQVALGRFLLTQQSTPESQAEAEGLLRSALAQDPKNDTAQVYLGQLLVQRGDAKDAVPLLESAVLTAPRRKEPWYNLARAYDILRNKERAAYCYAAFHAVSGYTNALGNTEEATRTQPKNPVVRLKLARLYAQGGNTAKAINQYQIYLSLRPGDAAVEKEMQTYSKRLKAAGLLPDMGLFNAMVMASTKFHP